MGSGGGDREDKHGEENLAHRNHDVQHGRASGGSEGGSAGSEAPGSAQVVMRAGGVRRVHSGGGAAGEAEALRPHLSSGRSAFYLLSLDGKAHVGDWSWCFIAALYIKLCILRFLIPIFMIAPHKAFKKYVSFSELENILDFM